MTRIDKERIKAVMLGYAVGDALGVPVEYANREALDKNPVTRMLSYGTHLVRAGMWSEDTSMNLAELASLAKGSLSFSDIMWELGEWYYESEYTASMEFFDLDEACSHAIEVYHTMHLEATECGRCDEETNGNGSLTRMPPFVLFLGARDGELCEKGMEEILDASSLTHAHMCPKLGCGIFAFIMMELLNSPSAESVYKGLAKAKERFADNPEMTRYARLFSKDFAALPRKAIGSGKYIVDTLEAAVWCLLNTQDYKACVLGAVNLGGDTNTLGAVAGSLAGAMYGYEAIPKEWLDSLAWKSYIEKLCEKAYENWVECFGEYKMTDTHLHIVPQFDDGASSMEMSREMLASLYAQGVRGMFCTSHSDCFLFLGPRGYREGYEKLSAESPIPMWKGCEVYCHANGIADVLQGLRSGKLPTYNGTDYVLAEFAPHETADEVERMCDILHQGGYIPVIAHAERCGAFADRTLADKLIGKGCLLQINAYSLEGETNENIRGIARRLLERKQAAFLGSDAHRTDHCALRIREGLRYIYAHADKDYADALCHGNAMRLLMGRG